MLSTDNDTSAPVSIVHAGGLLNAEHWRMDLDGSTTFGRRRRLHIPQVNAWGTHPDHALHLTRSKLRLEGLKDGTFLVLHSEVFAELCLWHPKQQVGDEACIQYESKTFSRTGVIYRT